MVGYLEPVGVDGPLVVLLGLLADLHLQIRLNTTPLKSQSLEQKGRGKGCSMIYMCTTYIYNICAVYIYDYIIIILM